MPTEIVVHSITEKVFTNYWMTILALSVPGYLLAIPVTASLAKRGLFLGRNPDRICFPGGQEGTGVYAKEREILTGIGLHVRELPLDLWFSGAAIALGYLLIVLAWDRYVAWVQSLNPAIDSTQVLIQLVVQSCLFVGAFFLAAVRRPRTGRL
jgi:hypothetical protein